MTPMLKEGEIVYSVSKCKTLIVTFVDIVKYFIFYRI